MIYIDLSRFVAKSIPDEYTQMFSFCIPFNINKWRLFSHLSHYITMSKYILEIIELKRIYNESKKSIIN